MQYTKYLQLRNNIYYFRFKIPTHLKKLTSKQEIVCSLKTDSLMDACAIIASKFSLIRLLKKMTPKINELQQLFDELTNFSDVDSFSSYQRKEISPEIDGLITVSREVLDDLQDNRLTDFSELTKTQPITGDVVRHKDFQNLFVRLLEAKIERAIYGRTPDFDKLISRANSLIVEPKTSPKLLSVYFKKFAELRKWTDKMAKDNNNLYLFLLAHWGDVDVTKITKQDIRKALTSYSFMPKGNKSPYNKMSIEERYKLPDISIPVEDLISPKTTLGLLKFLQGFFNSYLTKDLDLFVVSPTEGVTFKIGEVRGGAYSDSEVRVFEKKAHKSEGWNKWCLLLAIYTGARRAEIVKFLRDGTKYDSNTKIHYFELYEGKTNSAKRKIPVHSELIKHGVLSLLPIQVEDKAITVFINKLRDELKIPLHDSEGNKRVFHSFRHTFITKAVSKGHTIEKIQEVVGHSKSAGITTRYIHKLQMNDLLPVVNSVDYNN